MGSIGTDYLAESVSSSFALSRGKVWYPCVCVYVSGRDAQGRFFVYARILSRKGLEPGLVMG